jgi:hypothetical protein
MSAQIQVAGLATQQQLPGCFGHSISHNEQNRGFLRVPRGWAGTEQSLDCLVGDQCGSLQLQGDSGFPRIYYQVTHQGGRIVRHRNLRSQS